MTTTAQTKERLDLLMDWYCTLTRQSVRHIGQFYAPEVCFKDPFNDVQGVPAMMAIYEHMFDTTDDPRFVIDDRVVDGDQAFITWAFQFGLKGKPYVIIGSTHLKFNADGLVVLHRDYWDAAEELLQKLPVVGGLIRWLCSLFKTQI
ncbi:isomerase [Herbaspirillum sp. meg3]|uniref:nuclear transport factor 2 family protein n=1 Tax=Herbaspirillum sp. meg3 TaxID=2025949 RepID=UPI000B98DADC|nr:nuclear transport factor 2 family protein [Herbaspirillum sp. meg3]ASU37575.1 isomerase [Herbaspirillum sp. meg3]